jgi:hypothetical protein
MWLNAHQLGWWTVLSEQERVGDHARLWRRERGVQRHDGIDVRRLRLVQRITKQAEPATMWLEQLERYALVTHGTELEHRGKKVRELTGFDAESRPAITVLELPQRLAAPPCVR